jgi:predicted Ser/Thr protein kinase
MAEMNKCPQCGEEIPADAPEGLCPNCLLKVDLRQDESQAGPESNATTPYSGRFVPPQPAELAPHFPQLEILELLGQGGMGAVYKARQPGLDRLVALKILPREIGADPAFAERFTREARALARLSHPNIVAVYDFGRTPDGLFYFLMEFVDGVNLRQAIRAGSISPKDALAIVPQICDALQFAHDEGIVHRDIKPENVLLDKRGRVKIADFGLAKLLGHAPGDVSLTGTQQVMGTLRYMAPEQMEGTKAVDHRADIYSLGVVFYELLTGEVPVGRFAPPSKKVEIDVRLDEVVLRALEEKPEQRYQHASDVKTEVEAIRGSAPAAAPRQWLPEWTAILRRKAAVLALAIITLAAAASLCLLAGELAGADWYNKREMPYDWLASAWNWLLWAEMASLWYLWYMLAKAPDTRPSLIELACFPMRATVPPDPRMIRLWKVAGPFVAVSIVAQLIAVTISDLAAGRVFCIYMVAGPYVAVGALWWAYRPRPGDAQLLSAITPILPWWAPQPSPGGAQPQPVASVKAPVPAAAEAATDRGCIMVATLRTFTTADPTITKDLVVDGGAWLAVCTQAQTYRLFEVPEPGVEDCTVLYRAKLKTEGLTGRAHLEMWCRLPGRGEFFSKGLNQIATGSNNWATYEIPFFLKEGEKPDLIRLNLVVEDAGNLIKKPVAGKLWITDVELVRQASEPKTAEKLKGHDAGVTPANPMGHLALWAAIAGLVLPIVLVLGIGLLADVLKLNLSDGYLMLCGMLGIVLEVVALGGGIVGRRSASGKAALIISIISLVLYALFFMAVLVSPARSGGGSAVETVGEIADAVKVAMSSRAVITEEPIGEQPREALYGPFRYRVTGPVNHRATFWVEWWRDGVLDFQLTYGQWDQLPRGKGFDGSFEYGLTDGAKVSPDSAGKVRWDFAVESRVRNVRTPVSDMKKNDSRTNTGDWVANPFAGVDMTGSSWGQTHKWSVAPGEVATLLILRGGKSIQSSSISTDEDIAKKHKICMMLKARFDPVPEVDLNGTYTTALSANGVEAIQWPAAATASGLRSPTAPLLGAHPVKGPDLPLPRPDLAAAASTPGQAGKDEGRRDLAAVNDLAHRLLDAIRDKQDAALKELSADAIQRWRYALPGIARELRQSFQTQTGKPLTMQIGESFTLGDLAGVKCTGPKELHESYLVLFFIKTKSGWRNFFLRCGSPADAPLAVQVDEWRKRLDQVAREAKSPAGKPAALPAKDDGWTSLFDGKDLGRWKVVVDPEHPQGGGKVRVQDGQILLGEENTRAVAVIGWTGDLPTMDYEVEWEGMLKNVKEASFVVMFPVDKGLPSLGIHGENVEGKFGPIDGKPLAIHAAAKQPPLLDGRWYPFRIRVSRAEGIDVWVDGHPVVSTPIAEHGFGMVIPEEMRIPKSLGLGIHGPSEGALRNIRMRSLPPSPAGVSKPEIDTDLSPAAARELIPEAASMTSADFQKLASSPLATPAVSESQSLSLILMSLRPGEAAKTNPAALADFQYLEAPMPSRVAEAMWKTKSKGYATAIQPEFITNCTCRTENDTATGTVSFTAPGLYSGKVDFVARRTAGVWRIDEFRLPGYGIKTVRGEDGKWTRSDIAPK